MIKSLLVYIHILASVAIVGLVLWLLHDLWTVILAIAVSVTLTIALTRRKKG